jgi:hypothetical protein
MRATAFALEHICVDGGCAFETRALSDAWVVSTGAMVCGLT